MDSIMTGIEFFQKGGFVMYILLLCSLFVFSIGIERGLYFAKADSGRNFAGKFYLLMSEGKADEAMNVAQHSNGMLAALLYDSLQRLHRNPETIASYMEVQSGIVLAKLRARLYYLNVIVTMAPLLGLLGTIIGMISAFSIFNLESGQAMAITGGVGEALIATAMGLCVAIISLAVHAYFSQRIENIVTDMEQSFSLVEIQALEMKQQAGAAS